MKITKNKVEAGAAIVGSVALGAVTWWIATPLALGGWGYWRYRRWKKQLIKEVVESRKHQG
ncbi:hypothetical protein KJ885_06015 [Patescibacteria group bacterium]|nr:hypothetical protein [Patescibacteria group bacterium]